MTTMIAVIFTIESIGEKEIAHQYFKLLEKHTLLPQKIGLYEPLKTEYTFEKAVEMWSLEEEGCYVEGIGNTGKAGGVLARRKNPSILYMINWWKSPIKKYINYIELIFSLNTFKKYREKIENIFRDTIILTNGIYGYISHEIPEERQHVTGDLETRLPGVFWCNYFGPKYVDFFGEEKIASFPWYDFKTLENGGIITYLEKDPDDLIKSDELEMKAKLHLGINSFGDPVAYQENPDEIQIKDVPKF